MAMRQRQRRQEAERDNIRLKLVVKRQQQVAQTLGALVRRRALQVSKECTDLTTQSSLTHHVVNISDIEGDMEDFRFLFQRMETAYRGLEELFAANGLANADLPLDEIYLRESVCGGYFECFSRKVLPFELRATTEAVWEHFKGTEKHFGNGSLYTKAAKDLDEPYTIIENFTKELYSNSSRADIMVKQVVRRYVERDRDVVVWVARVVPAQVKHKMLRGLTYNLRGYAVTTRSQAAGKEVSMLQQCSHISFDKDPDARGKPTNLDALMNFLVVNSAQNIRSHRERIEDILVDQAVGRRLH
eukprot:jgi/Phyca11/558845/estExt2_Genewise1.C_PHYCAscaffold_20625